MEEKIRGQKAWSLNIREHEFYLEADSFSDDWKELSEVAETNYHCSYLLEGEGNNDDATIRFDDGTITISLRNPNHLQALIAKYDLKVYMSKQTIYNKKVLQETLQKIEKWEKILPATSDPSPHGSTS